jgi:hypothetical protein
MEFLKNKFYVYALVDPINRIPFYIGKGTGKRAYQHLKNDKINKDKLNYIQNIRNLGFEPEVHFLIENLEEKMAYDIEFNIIKFSFLFNTKLTNKVGLIIPPSRKGSKMSTESKEKIRLFQKSHKKTKMSEDTKQKLSKINLGKKGPKKVETVDIDVLRHFYIDKNLTKKQIMNNLKIGLGSLNRILYENGIKKTKENFSNYAKR